MPKRKIEIPNVDRDDPINDEALKIFVKAAKRYSDKTENLVSKNACTLYTRLTSQFIVGEKNNFDITEVEEYLNAYDTAEDPEQVTDIARMDLEDFLRRRGDLTYLTGFKCGDKFLNEGYYYVGVQLVGDNNFSSHALNMHVSKNGIISVIDARKGILEIFDSHNYLEKINHIHRTSFNHVTIEMMIPFS